jgi:hypothetical protein
MRVDEDAAFRTR